MNPRESSCFSASRSLMALSRWDMVVTTGNRAADGQQYHLVHVCVIIRLHALQTTPCRKPVIHDSIDDESTRIKFLTYLIRMNS
jgi:hypothetical protein